MKRYLIILFFAIAISISVSGCASKSAAGSGDRQSSEEITDVNGGNTPVSDSHQETPSTQIPQENYQADKESEDIMAITVKVGESSFSARLFDNQAASSFSAMLPVEISMSDLNGNEKYCYLGKSLPTSASRPSRIEVGDIMLFGSDCLVLFYESFSTSYSYTPIGHIDNPSGLSEALGGGSVTVSFSQE